MRKLSEKSPRPGFTLVELLTVIAVIAILALLSLGAVQRFRESADSSKCASNLRLIGLGILAYANDNDSRLPGPIYSSQYAWYSGNRHNVSMAFYVQRYVDLARNYVTREDVFLCPSYVKTVGWSKISYIPVSVANDQVTFRDNPTPQPPFGYPWSRVTGAKDQQPLRMIDLTNIVDQQGNPAASRTWALKDIDQLEPNVQTTYYFKDLPKTMVHGTHRNVLYFDWHIGRVDAVNKPL